MNTKKVKFRIMSDLHFDINLKHCEIKFEEADADTYTLIAGDVCGDIFNTKENLTRLFGTDKIIFVEGNHIVYSKDDIAISDRIGYLKKTFPHDNTQVFLENDVFEIPGTNTIIIGATLWTDWKLNGNEYLSKMIAHRLMNDYRFGKVWDESKYNMVTRRMTADDTQEFNRISFEYIKKIVEDNPTKTIVILSHHAPSGQSTDNDLHDRDLYPAYASNYTDFILNNPNIKLWVHGHVHENKDYMIGQCRVICNPLGYAVYDENPWFERNLIVEV